MHPTPCWGEQTFGFFVKHTIRECLVNPFCGYAAENDSALWYEFLAVESRLERHTASDELVHLC